MDSTLHDARQAFVNKDFNKSKMILLEAIASNTFSHNHKYYHKLGDVCMELKEFNDAHAYYEQSISLDTSNPLVFIKLANLLNHHFNNPNEAEQILNKCHKSHPNNDQCLYNYAKLMEDKDPETAIKLYRQCLDINDKRASVYHRLATILMRQSDDKSNQDNNIEYCLKRAISIQPNVANYHHQYAVHLQNVGKLNQANHQYQIALNLSNNTDTTMQCNYCIFLANCIGDKYQAMQYMKSIGLENDPQYLQLQELVEDEKHEETKNVTIKLVIYDFAVLTYLPLEINIDELNTMSHWDLITKFGGKGRVRQLRYHFENILDADQKPMILILSHLSNEVTLKALERIKLSKEYFKDIVIASNDRVQDIIKLKDDHGVFLAEEILYVPDSKNLSTEDTHNLFSQCSVYGIDGTLSKPLKGITLAHLQEIGCIVLGTEYHAESPNVYNKEYCLSQRDAQLYKQITEEIQQNKGKNRVRINSLPSMKSVIKADCKDWMEFGYKYCQMLNRYTDERWWECAHILVSLLKLEWDAPELWLKYAKCCSYIGENDEADIAFKTAHRLGASSFSVLYEYGYHLFIKHWYEEAGELFGEALRLSKFEKNASVRGLYVMMGRNAGKLGKLDEAEYFLRESVRNYPEDMIQSRDTEDYTNEYIKARYQYAKFLSKQNRYKEAKQELEICVANKTKNSIYHYSLADVLWHLGDNEGYKYHLDRTLEIDPYHIKARNDERIRSRMRKTTSPRQNLIQYGSSPYSK